MPSLLREPLVHFIVLAGMVFALWSFAGSKGEDEARTITLTREAIDRMASLYAVEAGAPPDPQTIQAIVADHVRESALAREARQLGLDDGDTIIERRLAQKMTFLLSDRQSPPEPDEAVLRAYHAENAVRYAAPARLTFQHVFLAGDDAERLESVRSGLQVAASDDWRGIGDATMVRRDWGDVPLREVERQFGRDFSVALLGLEPGPAWQGPIPSAFGQHFVRLTAKTDETALPFEAVETDVRADWLDAWRLEENARAVDAVVSRYDVKIEE